MLTRRSFFAWLGGSLTAAAVAMGWRRPKGRITGFDELVKWRGTLKKSVATPEWVQIQERLGLIGSCGLRNDDHYMKHFDGSIGSCPLCGWFRWSTSLIDWPNAMVRVQEETRQARMGPNKIAGITGC